MRRVAITGIGVICGAGKTREEFAQALREGRSGFRRITGLEICDLRFPNGAQLESYDPNCYFAPKDADMIDRFAQFAVVAAREAVAQSGIEWTAELAIAAPLSPVLRGRPEHGKPGLLGRLQDGQTARPPHDHPEDNGQRGRQRHIGGIRHNRPGLHHLDSVFLFRPRYRTGLWMVRSGMCDVALTGGSEAPFS